jgi:hypothetical protein
MLAIFSVAVLAMVFVSFVSITRGL